MLPLTPGSHSARRELNPRLALIRSRLWPLSYGPMGPEGVEPTPYRLKGGYAAITPQPRRRVGYRFKRIAAHHSSSSSSSPGRNRTTTGDVSDRHAPFTPPDRELLISP